MSNRLFEINGGRLAHLDAIAYASFLREQFRAVMRSLIEVLPVFRDRNRLFQAIFQNRHVQILF